MKIRSLKNLANAHHDSIWAATWAPATADRGALLITGSVDESVKIWKGDELELERTNTGHALGVVSVAAHPSGSMAASTSLDSFVRVFDVDTNATITTLETSPSEAWLMQFDPKVRRLLSSVFLLLFLFSSLILGLVRQDGQVMWSTRNRSLYPKAASTFFQTISSNFSLCSQKMSCSESPCCTASFRLSLQTLFFVHKMSCSESPCSTAQILVSFTDDYLPK